MHSTAESGPSTHPPSFRPTGSPSLSPLKLLDNQLVSTLSSFPTSPSHFVSHNISTTQPTYEQSTDAYPIPRREGVASATLPPSTSSPASNPFSPLRREPPSRPGVTTTNVTKNALKETGAQDGSQDTAGWRAGSGAPVMLVGGYRPSIAASVPATPIFVSRGVSKNTNTTNTNTTNTTTTTTSKQGTATNPSVKNTMSSASVPSSPPSYRPPYPCQASPASSTVSSVASSSSAVPLGRPHGLRPTTVVEDMEEEMAEEKLYALETSDDNTITLAINLLAEIRRGAGLGSSFSPGVARRRGGGGAPIPLKDAKREDIRRLREHQLEVVHHRRGRCEKKHQLMEEMYREAIARRTRAHAKIAADPPAERWIGGPSVLHHVPARFIPNLPNPTGDEARAGGGRPWSMPSAMEGSLPGPRVASSSSSPGGNHIDSGRLRCSISPNALGLSSGRRRAWNDPAGGQGGPTRCPHLLSLPPFLSPHQQPGIPRLGIGSCKGELQKSEEGGGTTPSTTSPFLHVFLTEMDGKEGKKPKSDTDAASFGSSSSSSEEEEREGHARKGAPHLGGEEERRRSSNDSPPRCWSRIASTNDGAPISSSVEDGVFISPSLSNGQHRSELREKTEKGPTTSPSSLIEEKSSTFRGASIPLSALSVPAETREAWRALGYEIMIVGHEEGMRRKRRGLQEARRARKTRTRRRGGGAGKGHASSPSSAKRDGKGEENGMQEVASSLRSTTSSSTSSVSSASNGKEKKKKGEEDEDEEEVPEVSLSHEPAPVLPFRSSKNRRGTALPVSSTTNRAFSGPSEIDVSPTLGPPGSSPPSSSSFLAPSVSSRSLATTVTAGSHTTTPSAMRRPFHRLVTYGKESALPAFLIRGREDVEGGLLLPKKPLRSLPPPPSSFSSPATALGKAGRALPFQPSRYPPPPPPPAALAASVASSSSRELPNFITSTSPLTEGRMGAPIGTTSSTITMCTDRHGTYPGFPSVELRTELPAWMQLAPLAPVYLVQRRLQVEDQQLEALMEASRRYRARKPVVATRKTKNGPRRTKEAGENTEPPTKEEYEKEEEREESHPWPSAEAHRATEAIDAQMDLISRTKKLKAKD